MAMNKIPTLVVGLGGIGCRIAANVNSLLDEESRKYVGVIGIDTNVEDIDTSRKQGLHTIRIGDDRRINEYLKENPKYTKWFPVHPLLVERGMKAGAGQIRTISRLAALAAEETGQFAQIKSEINRIRARKGDGSGDTIAVVITGSITGGTGAGMFLQIPYYIRNILKDTANLKNIVIRGIFLSPDVTEGVQPSNISQNSVKVNAYSCLKELNAIYLAQHSSENSENISFEYYDDFKSVTNEIDWEITDELAAADARVLRQNSTEPPYNYLYLVEKTARGGTLNNEDLSTVESLVSRTIFTLMFTPVIGSSLSVEDNFTLSQMEANYMNRYAGTGICRLRFPKEIAREYVVLSTIKDLVSKEWRLLDIKANEIIREAHASRNSDGYTSIPDYGEVYSSRFVEEVTKPEGKLGHLFADAYITSKNGTSTSIADIFFKNILTMIKTVADETSKKPIEADREKLKSFASVTEEVETKELALENFEKKAKTVCESKSKSIPNDIFPVSWESMNSRKESNNCIYKYLSEAHPIAARYFCYSLEKSLRNAIQEAKKNIHNIDLSKYRNKDFIGDPKQSGNAYSAIDHAKKQRRSIIPWFDSDEKKLADFAAIFSQAVKDQDGNIRKWLENTLRLNVCETLLRRVTKLSENYKLFFDGIETMIESNNARMRDLENPHDALGSKFLYYTEASFKKIAKEYRQKNNLDLPSNTKERIFTSIFRILASDLAKDFSEMDKYEFEKHEQTRKSELAQVFNNSIVVTIEENVVKYGDKIVNLSAKDAIIKEFELNNGVTKETAIDVQQYKIDLREYAQKRVEEAMNLAAPSLAVYDSAEVTNAELVFFAIHPSCAELVEGEANKGETKNYYFPVVTAATDNLTPTILMDEQFDPSEMVCMKNKYLYTIENLVKYAADGSYEKLYRERIDNINGDVTDPGSEEAYKTITTPHFHRFWHQEGYIPALTKNERKISERNIQKAFVYSMVYGFAKLQEDAEHISIPGDDTTNKYETWYDATTSPHKKIKNCGSSIGCSYFDFYKSLSFNRKFKEKVLVLAESKAQEKTSHRSSQEIAENIFMYDFIKGICYDNNIYDIVIQLCDYMDTNKYTKVFEGVIHCIWDYTAELLSKNQLLVNRKTIDILVEILENSKVGKKIAANASSEEDISYLSAAEKQLIEIHNGLLKQKYYA